MGKIKKSSLKWSFAKYIMPCVLVSMFGILFIGYGTNWLQDWYISLFADKESDEIRRFSFNKYYLLHSIIFLIISDAQILLIPLWAIFCVGITGLIFYNLELRKPIDILLNASKKISENQLDFTIGYRKQNELGQLCTAFDNMRKALDENNRNMWHLLEERKRLNSAFSHDLRTPLTVLKGYNDFLEKYSGQLSEEKTAEILAKMNSQINRLENYTYKMSAVQKLEDIVPEIAEIQVNKLRENFSESGKYISKGKNFTLDFAGGTGCIFTDSGLVMEVYENILSNAERYADNRIKADIHIAEDFLHIDVYDDGCGFSETALKLAKEPFYRDDKEQNGSHFGLGLYICKIICEKCGGSIDISNTEHGGKVSADFSIKRSY
ncbi:MAG: HAMP domain-containing histidine kinase [Ruminococcus flavefaciens]|nr:HAMP domain-containing histidine kinase [Ruminococcus flavefaciens]MCM1230595.1 HAMP domain-containing histidine kinase [Ruminococcus flavefaciens]